MAHNVIFDTDVQPIGVNSRCTACISHIESDFIGELHESNKPIKGFGGTKITNINTETLRWRWADNSVRIHTFIIPNSYYETGRKVRVLSP